MWGSPDLVWEESSLWIRSDAFEAPDLASCPENPSREEREMSPAGDGGKGLCWGPSGMGIAVVRMERGTGAKEGYAAEDLELEGSPTAGEGALRARTAPHYPQLAGWAPRSLGRQLFLNKKNT